MVTAELTHKVADVKAPATKPVAIAAKKQDAVNEQEGVKKKQETKPVAAGDINKSPNGKKPRGPKRENPEQKTVDGVA